MGDPDRSIPGEGLPSAPAPAMAADLGEDLIFEVLKRADARTLGRAACVSRGWRAMSGDERIWEAIYTRHWPFTGICSNQVRSFVEALGGFRRLALLGASPVFIRKRKHGDVVLAAVRWSQRRR